MSIFSYLKIRRKDFVNPSNWMGYDNLRAQHDMIWSYVRTLFVVPTSSRVESYEDALARLSTTDADMQHRATRYRQFALIFILCAILSFSYAFFLIFRYHTLTGFILSIATTGLFLSQGFRYDFWAMQIRRRKLGLTFKDWRNHVLNIGEQRT